MEKLGRFEKCRIAISKGITYDAEKGLVRGVRGNEIINKNDDGYIQICFTYNKKRYTLMAHQFIYYCVYGKYDENLDINHLNEIKYDNRISNLEASTRRYNIEYSKENETGFTGVKKRKYSFESDLRIIRNGESKTISVGSFNTAEIASVHRELAVLHEKELKSFSTEHRLEFRNLIKELYNTVR